MPSPISPRPDDDTAPRQRATEPRGGELHRHVRQRRRSLGDRGRRPDVPAGLHGVTEEAREHGPTGVLGLGPLRSAPHLAQHLGLAQHARTQPGRHLEEMPGHGVVEEHRPAPLQSLDRAPGHAGEELLEVGDALVEPLDHGVQLGAQAGRQHHDLGQVGPVAQSRDHLAEVVLGDRHPLEHVQGDLVLLESNDDHGQRLPELLARAGNPQRVTRPSVGPAPSLPGCRSAQPSVPRRDATGQGPGGRRRPVVSRDRSSSGPRRAGAATTWGRSRAGRGARDRSS